ncbi:MAG: RHS repeat-associated core domain-containing protein [Limisphaerales bacterium]
MTYTRGLGGLRARTDGNGSVYYHADGNGNITALMDTNQYVVARYLYDPFGKMLGKWGAMADANTYRFASKEYDLKAGFYNFGRRYYDPNLERFLSRDPLAECGGLNLYAYCGNDPLSLIDILGLCDPSMWDLFWQNVYNNGAQNAKDYANGVENGLEGAANSLLHPLDTVAGLGTLAGNIYEDPSGVANGLWDSLQTSEGIGNLVGGLEAGLAIGGGAAALSRAGAVAEIAPAEFAAGTAGETVGVAGETAVGETSAAETTAARVVQNTSGRAETATQARFVVTESGTAIPTDAAELKSNLQLLKDTSTSPATSRKFVGADSQGPIRVRIEKAHPDDPNYTGPINPLHTVDHLHIERRANGTTGDWAPTQTIPYEWPF